MYTYSVRPQSLFHICVITGAWKQQKVDGFKPVVRLGDKVVYQGPRVSTEDEAHTLCQEAISSLRSRNKENHCAQMG